VDHSYFFCPNPRCRRHRLGQSDSTWYYRHGHHDTHAFGRVQRYRCRACGRTFSDQTFLLNYWLKKATDFRALGREINSSSSGNFVGRHHHFSADSLRIRQDRLARNALYLQALAIRKHPIRESLVADGLESFVESQFFPVNINILVGKKSQFIYYFTESHSRRKGTKTAKQEARCSEVYADKSFEESKISVMFEKLVGFLRGRCATKSVRLDTDELPIYRSVIERWNQGSGGGLTIDHHETPSTLPRTTGNHLFAVNYIDRLIRKDVPNHRRETICFARNDRNLLSRFAYYAVTHNFFKPFRVNSHAKQSKETHAERAFGLSGEIEKWKARMHEFRFFRTFVELPEYFDAVWFRRTPTPLKASADPVPAFVYQ
jgi:hypothetical protein